MTTDLARKGIEIVTIDDAERLARIAVASGLTALRRPEEAAVILLTGRELGLAPMQSLRGIHVVQGRPVLSADLMVAIVRRSGLCASWRTIESTPDTCTIETRREGETEAARKTWTTADAARAGLTAKGGNWKAYPAQMLRHRCASDLAREVYPDVVLGLYDPDELGAVEPRSTLDAVVVEPVEDRPEDASRAMACYADALEDADRPSQVRAAYLALVDGLRAEGKDPADWAKPAQAEALAAVRYLGWAPTTAELGQLLSVAGHDLVATLDTPTSIAPGALPLWYSAHKATVEALPGNHAAIAKVLVARRLAGLTGEPDAAATKRANAAFGRAIAELPAEPVADADAPFPQHEGDEDWYGSPVTVRAYLDAKTSRREVERAVRKHAQRLRSDAASRCFVNAAVERLHQLAATRPGSDGTMPTAGTLHRDVAQWAEEGPTQG